MHSSLKALALVGAYLFAAATAGSVLAWLLYGLTDHSYYKILSRAVLLFAALGLLPMWRIAGLSAASIGLVPFLPRAFIRTYLLGLIAILPPALFFVVVGFRVIDPRIDVLSMDIFRELMLAIVSGILVGVFEESLFRGVLYGFLRRLGSFIMSACVVAALYASVHFLDVSSESADEIQWYTGYGFVAEAFTGLANPGGYWDAFLALFLLGLLFCWVRERYGLWWCIGLHASWVCAIRMFKVLTVRDIYNPYAVMASDYDNFVGVMVAIWLVFIFVCLHLRRTVKASWAARQT